MEWNYNPNLVSVSDYGSLSDLNLIDFKLTDIILCPSKFFNFNFEISIPTLIHPIFSLHPHFKHISVREAHDLKFQIPPSPYPFKFVILTSHLTTIILFYLKIINTIIYRLDPNQSEKCKYNPILV